jgi:hypothetical protein
MARSDHQIVVFSCKGLFSWHSLGGETTESMSWIAVQTLA